MLRKISLFSRCPKCKHDYQENYKIFINKDYNVTSITKVRRQDKKKVCNKCRRMFNKAEITPHSMHGNLCKKCTDNIIGGKNEIANQR